MGIVPKKFRRRLSRRERHHFLTEAAFEDEHYQNILTNIDAMHEIRDCFLQILQILPISNETVRRLTHLYFELNMEELAQDFYLKTLAHDSYESIETVLDVIHMEYHFTMTQNDKDVYLEQIKRIIGPIGRFRAYRV